MADEKYDYNFVGEMTAIYARTNKCHGKAPRKLSTHWHANNNNSNSFSKDPRHHITISILYQKGAPTDYKLLSVRVLMN